jgi:hypothetical protein
MQNKVVIIFYLANPDGTVVQIVENSQTQTLPGSMAS